MTKEEQIAKNAEKAKWIKNFIAQVEDLLTVQEELYDVYTKQDAAELFKCAATRYV